MSERASALQGASFDGFVRVEEAGLHGMITLRGDLSAAGIRDAASGVAGVEFPGRREARFARDRGLCWMSPDELLVLCAHADAPGVAQELQEALKGTHHLVANVSDARALFRVSGAGAREALAKLTPADLSPDAFGPGRIRRSRLAQVPAAFWMRGADSFEVICFRSVARYVFDILSLSAAPGGDVGYF